MRFPSETVSTQPYLSAIVTVFNGERFLREALQSLLSQTFTDFELIVVNDGSTDGTAAIIGEYDGADPRIRPVKLPHVGRAEALNTACKLARGTFIAILDADDVALPMRFERQTGFLREHKGVALLGSAVEKVNDNGRSCGIVTFPTQSEEIKARLPQEGSFAHSTVVMETDAVHRVGGYRKAFPPAEDYDLWLRLAERREIANLPDVLVRYRVHQHQVSTDQVERHTLSVLGARVAARSRRETGIDPTESLDSISFEFLEQNGLTRAYINGSIVDSFLSTSLNLWGCGATDLAIETLNRALEWSRATRCEPTTTARIHALLSSRHARARRPLKSLAALARAYRANPADAKALLSRSLGKLRPHILDARE